MTGELVLANAAKAAGIGIPIALVGLHVSPLPRKVPPNLSTPRGALQSRVNFQRRLTVNDDHINVSH
jgi:hypothetical protein